MTELIDGKAIAAKVVEGIKREVSMLKRKPGLAVVLVGEDPASKVYVNMKDARCKEAGIYSEKHELNEDVTEKELVELIERLNKDEKINGILVQLPLPKHLDEDRIVERVSPKKDVDGFHFVNLGKLLAGCENVLPCTPKAVIRLLEACNIGLEGKDVVVIGRSKIVGRPLAIMLVNRNATVTICHTKTRNLSEKTRKADIVVVAAGKARLLTADMVKTGAVVIDVGINRAKGKLVGDVDFEHVKEKAAFITPVPGGVGPMTVAMLLENTVELYKHENSL